MLETALRKLARVGHACSTVGGRSQCALGSAAPAWRRCVRRWRGH